MNFIRNTLRYKLPGEDFRCDIVMSVPAGYDQVSATAPYYRSTYVLVYPKGKGLDQVRSGADLFALPSERRSKLTIGIYDKSPASAWLVKHGMEAQAKPYQMLSPDPEQYPGEIIEKDLAQGKIDAAIVWGPIAGYYAKRVRNVDLAVIPLKSEPGVKFDYEIAMGVRYGEPEWKATVQKLIARESGGDHGDPARVRRSVGERARRAHRISAGGLVLRARFSSGQTESTIVVSSSNRSH